MNRQTLPIAAAIALLLILLFSFTRYNSQGKAVSRTLLTGKKNEQAVKNCLTVQVMDKSLQGDGKVFITYTNTCDNFEFQLTKTGMKYETWRGPEFLVRKTPLIVPPRKTEIQEISIPFGIWPTVAFAHADDVKAFKL